MPLYSKNQDESIHLNAEHTSAIGTSAVDVFAQNGARKQITICNHHAANTLYYRYKEDAAEKVGVAVPPNTCVLLDSKIGIEKFSVISDGANTDVYIAEFE